MSIFEILDAARTMAIPQKPAPSWQADPTARHQLRYWDGERWTAWVADDGTQAEDALELGQAASEWTARWDNPAIRDLRAEVFASRLGVSTSEWRAIEALVEQNELAKLAQGRSDKLDHAIALLRTPRDQVIGGWTRTQQAALLNVRNADLLARGLAVALVHCRRCAGVVYVTYRDNDHRYLDPNGHHFVVDDITVVAPDQAGPAQAALAAGPPHKGVRF
jgi:hypothetical protein